MIESKLKRNFIYAFFSQLVSLIISIFVSLITPKVFGIEEYGYYQLFIFYSNYVGFTLFGINDGIYLRYGGIKKDNLNKSLLTSQFFIVLISQIILTFFCVFLVSFFDISTDRAFVIFFTLIYMILFNLSGFIGFIFQTVNDTDIYSKSILIEKIFFIISIIIFFFVKYYNYKTLIIFYAISKLICLLYCIYKGKEYVFNQFSSFSSSIKETFLNIFVGIKLMFSNIASMLLIGVGRFIVDIKWGITYFSKISLLLSITSFILVFISQFSMVLFPHLRQYNNEKQKKTYIILYELLHLTLPLILFAYIPLQFFINSWLPAYADTVEYLIYLLPFCIFETKMYLLNNTFLKVYRKENFLLFVNLLSTIICFIGCLISAFYLNSILGVLISIVMSVSIRSYFSEVYLLKFLNISKFMYLIMEIFIILISIFVYNIFNYYMSLICILISYLVYICFSKSSVTLFIYILKQMIRR